jgi:peptide/nickel transport system permease protein
MQLDTGRYWGRFTLAAVTSVSAPRSLPAALLRTVRTDRWALAGAIVIVLLVFVAAAAPLLAAIEGQPPNVGDISTLHNGLPAGPLGGISATHWFGVEPQNGRDLFARVCYGARTSFLIGLTATVVAVVVGTLLGASAGYLGGWFNRVITWLTDVLLGFPYLVFMIALGAIAPPSVPKPLLLTLVIGFFGWPSITRIVRSQTLALRERKFVSSARAMGAGPWHVFRTELLPNLWAPIIVVATLNIPYNIGFEAALSFLGAGINPPTASWGQTISSAKDWIQTDPMFLLFPSAALFLATWSFNVFGDGLRDALDPRMVVRR